MTINKQLTIISQYKNYNYIIKTLNKKNMNTIYNTSINKLFDYFNKSQHIFDSIGNLSKEQTKTILEILNSTNLSHSNERREFLAKIKTDSLITKFVHLAITSGMNVEENLLRLDHELITAVLEELDDMQQMPICGIHEVEEFYEFETEQLFAKNDVKKMKWLNKYSYLFNPSTLKLIDNHNLLYLAKILFEDDSIESPLETLKCHLPEKIQRYCSLFNVCANVDDFWEAINKIESFELIDKYRALSLFMETKRIPYIEIMDSNFGKEHLGQFTPYLRYGNLANLSKEAILRVLEEAKDLSYIIISNDLIESLPNLPNCKILNCKARLSRLPELPSCKIVTVVSQYLTQAPTLSSAQFLNFSDCLNVTEICSQPNCKTLFVPKNVTKIGEIPHCKQFYNLNGGIKILPPLSKCESLNIKGSSVETLPDLPLVKFFDCSETDIRIIPNLPQCIAIHCTDAKNLQRVLGLPLAANVTFINCDSLDELPDLRLCRFLLLMGCLSLQHLPERLEHCIDFFSQDNHSLISIPDLPECVRFFCHICPSLVGIPRMLPSCSDFTLEDCGHIFNRPLLKGELEIDLEELAQDPIKVLIQFDQQLTPPNYIFPRIYYKKSQEFQLEEPIDIGGVKRDFLTRLMESLFKKTDESSRVLPMEQGEPLADEQTGDYYFILGKIFTLCYLEDSPFKTGSILPLTTYHKIATLPYKIKENELTDQDLIGIYILFYDLKNVLKLFNPNIPLESIEIETLDEAFYLVEDGDYGWNNQNSLNEYHQDKIAFFQSPAYREQFSKALFQDARKNKRLTAVMLIGKSMAKFFSEEEWDALRAQGGDVLHDRIEGVLTSESLLKNILWEYSENVTIEDHEKTKRYMETWIKDASLEKLRLFLRFATGISTLSSEPVTIQVYNQGKDNIPISHTCSNTVEISAGYSTQNHFNYKIEYSMAEGMGGTSFQMP